MSWQTDTRQTEFMNNNLNNQLLDILESDSFYAKVLDESCDVKDTAQLLIFNEGISEDSRISEGF